MRRFIGVTAVLLVLCAGLVAGCGTGTAPKAAGSRGPTPALSVNGTSTPPDQVSPGPSPAPSAGGAGTPAAGPVNLGTVTATNQSNGQTVDLRPGQSLRVVLSSTYWKIRGSSDSGVLSQISGPSTQPQMSGCVPGGGCGTVTAVYRATAAGRAQVSAFRSVCGEALGCSAANSSFVVYVVVQ